jgi:hypothetical protein
MTTSSGKCLQTLRIYSLGFGAFFLNSGDDRETVSQMNEVRQHPPINFLGKLKKRKSRMRKANPRALGTNPRALGTNPKAMRLKKEINE